MNTSNIKKPLDINPNKFATGFKLLILIESKTYIIFYNKYTIKTKFIKNDIYVELEEFKNKFFYYIIKILPNDYYTISEYGIDNFYLRCGILQCKPIEYYEQLFILDDLKIEECKNNPYCINYDYYFIGYIINELFVNFEKFNNFIDNEDLIKYKNKYIKYKNKYTKK